MDPPWSKVPSQLSHPVMEKIGNPCSSGQGTVSTPLGSGLDSQCPQYTLRASLSKSPHFMTLTSTFKLPAQPNTDFPSYLQSDTKYNECHVVYTMAEHTECKYNGLYRSLALEPTQVYFGFKSISVVYVDLARVREIGLWGWVRLNTCCTLSNHCATG